MALSFLCERTVTLVEMAMVTLCRVSPVSLVPCFQNDLSPLAPSLPRPAKDILPAVGFVRGAVCGLHLKNITSAARLV